MERYQDKSLSPKERAKDFLKNMTLEAKFSQIRSFNGINMEDVYQKIVKGEDVEVFSLVYGSVQNAEHLKVVSGLLYQKDRNSCPDCL